MGNVREVSGTQVVPRNFYRGATPSSHQARRHAAVLGMARDLHGSVLDVGCGYGDLAWALSKTLDPVHGVDVDSGRVAFASEQYAPIPFSVCRADRLDFADSSFDNVVSIVVLPFVPDVDMHMSELRRVLKPGGNLVLATRSPSWLHRLRCRVTGAGTRSKLHLFTVSEARTLLARHRFELSRCSAFYDPPFESRRNLGDWIKASGEWIGETFGADGLAPYGIFLARPAVVDGEPHKP